MWRSSTRKSALGCLVCLFLAASLPAQADAVPLAHGGNEKPDSSIESVSNPYYPAQSPGKASVTRQPLHQGISVGYKQIDLPEPIELEGIRLRVAKSVDTPRIKSFAAHEMKDLLKTPRDAGESAGKNPRRKAGEIPLTDQGTTVAVNLTKHITDVGQYEAEVEPAAGIEFKKVVVVMAETETPRLITKLDRPNAWNINRTAAVADGPKGRTLLRVVAKSTGGESRTGEVYIRKAE